MRSVQALNALQRGLCRRDALRWLPLLLPLCFHVACCEADSCRCMAGIADHIHLLATDHAAYRLLFLQWQTSACLKRLNQIVLLERHCRQR